MRTTLALTLLGALALTACSDGSTDPSNAPIRSRSVQASVTASVAPYVVAGDPTCAELDASWKELRIRPPTSGSYQTADDIFHATLATADGIRFDWTAQVPAAAVLVPGNSSTNVYAYTSPVTSDVDLHSAPGAGGQPVAPGRISVCYDEDIAVLSRLDFDVTAFARFTRTWSWNISKSADQSSLVLPIGAQATVNYTVEANATYVDSDLSVHGDITVVSFLALPPQVALQVTVTDGINEMTQTCDVDFPCPYSLNVAKGSASLTAIVRATRGDDTVELSKSAQADLNIAERDEIDENIDVTDDQHGYLGYPFAQVGDTWTPFYYSRSIGPYAACGEYTVTNTASFISVDAGRTGSASWSIVVKVPCAEACTLGVGYWKTHSRFGPATYDDTWALLGEDTPFFLSGRSYYEVLRTPPRGGNAYYILAHAYIAAKLNILGGADPGAAQAAMTGATALFDMHTPVAEWGRSVRAQFLELAGVLERYNNGAPDTGACAAERTAASGGR